MTIFEKLENEACAEGIDLLMERIPVKGMTAAYFRTPGGAPKIVIEPNTLAKNSCDLAEELGHHQTGTDGIVRYNTIAEWKAEARARKWAHDKMLSPDAIRTAAENTDDIFEIAEALGVTVRFLREAVDDYMARGLWAI